MKQRSASPLANFPFWSEPSAIDLANSFLPTPPCSFRLRLSAAFPPGRNNLPGERGTWPAVRCRFACKASRPAFTASPRPLAGDRFALSPRRGTSCTALSSFSVTWPLLLELGPCSFGEFPCHAGNLSLPAFAGRALGFSLPRLSGFCRYCLLPNRFRRGPKRFFETSSLL